MKKIVLILISFVLLFSCTSCASENEDYLPEIMESLEKNVVSIKEKSEEVMQDDGSLVDKMNKFDQELYTKDFNGGDVSLTVSQSYDGIDSVITALLTRDEDDAKQRAIDTYFEIYDYFNENGIELGWFYFPQRTDPEETAKLYADGNFDDKKLHSCVASVGNMDDGMAFEVYLMGDLVNPAESEVISLYR